MALSRRSVVLALALCLVALGSAAAVSTQLRAGEGITHRLPRRVNPWMEGPYRRPRMPPCTLRNYCKPARRDRMSGEPPIAKRIARGTDIGIERTSGYPVSHARSGVLRADCARSLTLYRTRAFPCSLTPFISRPTFCSPTFPRRRRKLLHPWQTNQCNSCSFLFADDFTRVHHPSTFCASCWSLLLLHSS